jgi:hypothetical protein
MTDTESIILTSTTISGLGTATDGKIGMLRVGSTPYEFITVVYDATYAKWVSPEQAMTKGAMSRQDNVQRLLYNAQTDPGFGLPWTNKNTAGLSPQSRACGHFATAGNGTAEIQLAYWGADYSGAGPTNYGTWTSFTGYVALGSVATTTAAAPGIGWDSGWIQPSSPTVKDMYFTGVAGRNVDNASWLIVTYAIVHMTRWVG